MTEVEAVTVLTVTFGVPYSRARGYITEAHQTGTAFIHEARNHVVMRFDGNYTFADDGGDVTELVTSMAKAKVEQ